MEKPFALVLGPLAVYHGLPSSVLCGWFHHGRTETLFLETVELRDSVLAGDSATCLWGKTLSSSSLGKATLPFSLLNRVFWRFLGHGF